jgi:hypothetical protein
MAYIALHPPIIVHSVMPYMAIIIATASFSAGFYTHTSGDVATVVEG